MMLGPNGSVLREGRLLRGVIDDFAGTELNVTPNSVKPAFSEPFCYDGLANTEPAGATRLDRGGKIVIPLLDDKWKP
jgi:hypothetical protein